MQVVRQMAKRKYIKYGIVVLITALLVFYFRDSWGETAREIMHTPLKNVLAVTGLSTCFFLIDGRIIQMLAGRTKQEFSVRQGIGCAFYCALFRMVTFGSGTAVAEVFYLNKKKVLPAKASSAAVVQYTAQRIAVGVYGTAGFLFLSLKNRQLLGKYHTYLPAGIGICILIAAVLLTISVSKTAAGCIFQAADRAAAKHPKWKEKLEKARE